MCSFMTVANVPLRKAMRFTLWAGFMKDEKRKHQQNLGDDIKAASSEDLQLSYVQNNAHGLNAHGIPAVCI